MTRRLSPRAASRRSWIRTPWEVETPFRARRFPEHPDPEALPLERVRRSGEEVFALDRVTVEPDRQRVVASCAFDLLAHHGFRFFRLQRQRHGRSRLRHLARLDRRRLLAAEVLLLELDAPAVAVGGSSTRLRSLVVRARRRPSPLGPPGAPRRPSRSTTRFSTAPGGQRSPAPSSLIVSRLPSIQMSILLAALRLALLQQLLDRLPDSGVEETRHSRYRLRVHPRGDCPCAHRRYLLSFVAMRRSGPSRTVSRARSSTVFASAAQRVQ